MKENIEDEVITLADGKTANNLRGAALIGIGIGSSETEAGKCKDNGVLCHDLDDTSCCQGKFICLKLVTK